VLLRATRMASNQTGRVLHDGAPVQFFQKTKGDRVLIKKAARSLWVETLQKNPKAFEAWWGSVVRVFNRAARLDLIWLTRVPDMKTYTLRLIMMALEKDTTDTKQLAQWVGGRFRNVYSFGTANLPLPYARFLEHGQHSDAAAALVAVNGQPLIDGTKDIWTDRYNMFTYDVFPQLRPDFGETSLGGDGETS